MAVIMCNLIALKQVSLHFFQLPCLVEGMKPPPKITALRLHQRRAFSQRGCLTAVYFILSSWFATTWQGGHVGGQYNKNCFSKNLHKNIFYFPGERNAFVLNHHHMAALTSPANKQLPITRHFSQCHLTLAKKLLANDKIFASLSQKKINVTNSKHEL